ncbi:hypothetical protein LDENG_00215510, partial [Lucifuga dentata]
MQDIPAFFCGLTFCYRTCLPWTILLVTPWVITSALCLRLRFQSLRLDSSSDCICVGSLSCQFFCLLLCWTENPIKELNLSELYCVLHLGPNPTCHTLHISEGNHTLFTPLYETAVTALCRIKFNYYMYVINICKYNHMRHQHN